jgi:superfamily II DNA or RNA helicase
MSQAFKLQTKNENFEVNFNKLDDSQRAAVEASGNNVVIRAAAGSGKTSTLITAIAAYRYEDLTTVFVRLHTLVRRVRKWKRDFIQWVSLMLKLLLSTCGPATY